MSYTKHNFVTGGAILAAPFNEMEDQIAANEAAIAEKASSADLAGKLNKPSGNGTSGQLLQTNGDGTTAWVNAPSGGSGVTVDATLSASGQAADAKATGDALALKAAASALTELTSRVAALENMANHLSGSAKQALLQIASKAAYIDDGGQTYYQALYAALYGNAPTPASISAVFTPGGATFSAGDSLNGLKPYLTVTVTNSDGTTETVSDYTLSGTLAVGTNTITAAYGTLTDTFTVTVASLLPAGYTQLQYIYSYNSYINTGVDETQAARARYKILVRSITYNKGNHILSSTNTYFPFLRGSTSVAQSEIGFKLKGSENLASGSKAFTWELQTEYTIEGFIGDSNEVKVNGTVLLGATAGSNAVSGNYFNIFCTGDPSSSAYFFHGNLYFMEIYDSSGNLLRNFIPCKNSSDVAGLYDTVTESFYTSGNESALTAGPAA
ncbi:MAG: hypothetical protein IJI53_09730 [Clostridia bacterium]|nr:hypothetical protein [Clostridia bacterium]